VQNLLTGKKYIGQHKFCSSNEEFQKSDYCGSGNYLQNSINKYGLQNFKKWVLIHCRDLEANHYEKLWIKKLNTKHPSGYNLTDGGGGFSGVHTEETKKKMKEKATGRIILWKDKISIGVKMAGKHSPDSYKKGGMKTRGRIQSETEKENRKNSYTEKRCIICSTLFKPSSGASKICTTCRKINNKKWHWSENAKQRIKNRIYKHICQKCDIEFNAKTVNKKLCEKCKNRLHNKHQDSCHSISTEETQ